MYMYSMSGLVQCFALVLPQETIPVHVQYVVDLQCKPFLILHIIHVACYMYPYTIKQDTCTCVYWEKHFSYDCIMMTMYMYMYLNHCWWRTSISTFLCTMKTGTLRSTCTLQSESTQIFDETEVREVLYRVYSFKVKMMASSILKLNNLYTCTCKYTCTCILTC